MTEPLHPARGFGPGLAPEGAALQLAIDGGQLRLKGWPGHDRVARDQLVARRQGDALLLEWSTPAGNCALACSGPAAAALAVWLPPQRTRTDGATRFWLWAALFLLLGLPVLLLLGFFGFRATLVDAVVERIPVAREQALAEQLWAMQRPRLKLIEGRAANRFIEQTGARLAAARPGPYQYRFHLADDASVNAFAMPAGYVVIHRGLIERAASAEQVAGVMAHEIEHVEQRHSLRGLVQSLGLRAAWAAVSGDLGGGIVGEWAQNLAGLHFSREQESSADSGGYGRLLAAGIDPRGMASFFDRLAADQSRLPATPELLATHPASSERSARLKALASGVPPAAAFKPLADDWPAIQASLKP